MTHFNMETIITQLKEVYPTIEIGHDETIGDYPMLCGFAYNDTDLSIELENGMVDITSQQLKSIIGFDWKEYNEITDQLLGIEA